MYRDEDFSQVVDIAVGPLRQARSEAEEVIHWASRDESAQVFVAEVDGKAVGFLVHPNYFAEAAELLKALVEKSGDGKAGKLQAYAAATDRSRTEILRLCGFKREATMPAQLRIGSQKIDLEIYSIVVKG